MMVFSSDHVPLNIFIPADESLSSFFSILLSGPAIPIHSSEAFVIILFMTVWLDVPLDRAIPATTLSITLLSMTPSDPSFMKIPVIWSLIRLFSIV